MAKTGDSCTFCGRGSRDVNMLINGISGAICDECAQQAYEIVKEQMPGNTLDVTDNFSISLTSSIKTE